MSQTTRVLLALIAGLVVGAVLAAIDQPDIGRIVGWLEPAGTLWLNALRMTVVPLVVALLITAAASATAHTGRLAARALITFVVLLTAGALFVAILMPVVLAAWPVDPEAAAALREGLGAGATQVPDLPPLRDVLTNVIPTNPFAVAVSGDMLPLVIFALLFGFAATRVAAVSRDTLLGFFQGIADVMLVIVHWVLWLAPVGVFVLALGVGFHGGVRVAGALTQYLVLMCAVSIAITMLLYPIVVFFGGFSLTAFARAAAPAQAVGFSTQSSLASLPAMLESATQLGIPRHISGLVLPLAVSLFRITSPPVNLAIVLFVAHVYGVDIGVGQLAAGVVVAVLTQFAVVGVPSAATFFTTTVPISLAMGVPVELLGLLIAVEVIPDLFRTLGNVSGDLTVTTLVARREKRV